MKKVLPVFLGILTAIGGFVDMGDLVANAAVGARFGMNLAWVVILGIVGIVLYAEMSGRVAAITGRAVFDLVRDRLGPRAAALNLGASFFINALTLIAELAGVAIAISLVASVSYLLLVPLVAVLVWLVIWRMPFERMEQVFGLLGLGLVVFVVAVVRIGPDWSELLHEATAPKIPHDESIWTTAYYAVALFGAAMTPYEVFFFSSGAVEERWTSKDLAIEKANVLVGFPLGGLLSLGIMAASAIVLLPAGIEVEQLSQVPLPVVESVGKVGLAVALVGIFGATFGAALETALSAGYGVAQYFGWQWGKYVRPRQAARFHLVVVLTIMGAALVALSGVDPVKVTEYSIVLSAAALPLTYLPILVVANDPEYMGDRCNGRFTNLLASIYLVILLLVAVAAIPLIIITKGGA
ncbi:NRAMP family divalent metal transporter [Dermatobacter hominis]|uniref:NRAMP family divalent metal transporter n=1 Tax=Dermatobacter hominis TaxID=2884263 RepID=UPI001D11ED6F|nr:divalent metal cation transporter [Dermatobacter hominis]UDY37470.1 divalent metal cation transporter [Dermatobacter hominis]